MNCRGDCAQGHRRCPHPNLCQHHPDDDDLLHVLQLVVLATFIGVLIAAVAVRFF